MTEKSEPQEVHEAKAWKIIQAQVQTLAKKVQDVKSLKTPEATSGNL